MIASDCVKPRPGFACSMDESKRIMVSVRSLADCCVSQDHGPSHAAAPSAEGIRWSESQGCGSEGERLELIPPIVDGGCDCLRVTRIYQHLILYCYLHCGCNLLVFTF
jgi:hypothetical protein